MTKRSLPLVLVLGANADICATAYDDQPYTAFVHRRPNEETRPP